MGNYFCYEEDKIGCISFNFEIISYKLLLYFLYLSPRFTRDTTTSEFTSIKNNRCNKSHNEDFFLIPNLKINRFTIVFKPIISFPYPNNRFLNSIIPIELGEYQFQDICMKSLTPSCCCHIQRYHKWSYWI